MIALCDDGTVFVGATPGTKPPINRFWTKLPPIPGTEAAMKAKRRAEEDEAEELPRPGPHPADSPYVAWDGDRLRPVMSKLAAGAVCQEARRKGVQGYVYRKTPPEIIGEEEADS